MVKVNIISGFLGAGKTTLIKKLLTGSVAKEKIILLENEYGEVGVARTQRTATLSKKTRLSVQ